MVISRHLFGSYRRRVCSRGRFPCLALDGCGSDLYAGAVLNPEHGLLASDGGDCWASPCPPAVCLHANCPGFHRADEYPLAYRRYYSQWKLLTRAGLRCATVASARTVYLRSGMELPFKRCLHQRGSHRPGRSFACFTPCSEYGVVGFPLILFSLFLNAGKVKAKGTPSPGLEVKLTGKQKAREAKNGLLRLPSTGQVPPWCWRKGNHITSQLRIVMNE